MNPSSKVAVTHSLLSSHHVQVSVSCKALSVTFIGLLLSNRWLTISKRSSHAHRRTPDVKCRVCEARERGRFTREGIRADPDVSAGDHSLICPSTSLRTDTANGLPASFRRAEGWGIVTAIPLFFSVGVLAAAIGIECEFHFGDVNETIPVPNDVLADVVV